MREGLVRAQNGYSEVLSFTGTGTPLNGRENHWAVQVIHAFGLAPLSTADGDDQVLRKPLRGLRPTG